ncbi:MAG: SLC45 family MFS transporter [Chloroflexi bacterium]|nr:SLC45 family MFS transporter [Chloroflexota bacterium]
MSIERAFRPVDYVKISIFAAALSVLWPSLHSVIIPLRLLEFAPEAQKNTYLGLMTFAGSMIAVFVQPLAGAVSDRFSSRFGRRRPFILVGTLLALLFLPSIGLSGSFPFLLIGYCLLQVATNIAQGPFQAFIPDLVPKERRGVASGAKGVAEILGGVAFLRVVAYFMDNYASDGGEMWLWLAIGLPGLILLGGMIATMLTVKEQPSFLGSQPSMAKTMAGAYKIDVKEHLSFVWFLLSRLFILMAMVVLQTFALYFVRDVIHHPNPAGVTADLLITVGVFLLLAVYPAGQLSDRFGRKLIIILSGLVGIVGILVIFFTRSYVGTLVCGGLLGISSGAFLSTNWALATDLVPAGEEARYLGLANIATAGAGALARLTGPVIDFFNIQQSGLGYSVMLLICVFYFALGSALVIPVRLKSKEG